MPAANKTTFAIAANSNFTSNAGIEIAEAGGNIADVAAACALTATVSEIIMCSLGGSACIMTYFPGKKSKLYDGIDAMPDLLSRPGLEIKDSFRKAHVPYGDGITVRVGHGTVAVPGMLASIEKLWKDHGSLPWSEIVSPALELSKKEIPADPLLEAWLNMAGKPIFFNQEASRKTFFPDGKTSVKAGSPYKIPNMDSSLEEISKNGVDSFYRGDLARAFVKEMSENCGFVTEQDLASYRCKVRDPLSIHTHGFELALNPPPAVGGASVGSLIRILEIAEYKANRSEAHWALQTANSQLCMLRIKEELAKGDEKTAGSFLEKKTLLNFIGKIQSPNTTHFSVAGSDGSLIAVTMSNGYGSGITIPGTGIICNNSVGEPEMNPKGYHKTPTGSRLVTNMAPVVAWNSSGQTLALGSPGASRITTAIGQVWTRISVQGKSYSEAVSAPRLHVEEWEDGLRAQCEPGIDIGLLSKKYRVRPFNEPDMFFGAVNLAGLDKNGKLEAISDFRRKGKGVIF